MLRYGEVVRGWHDRIEVDNKRSGDLPKQVERRTLPASLDVHNRCARDSNFLGEFCLFEATVCPCPGDP